MRRDFACRCQQGSALGGKGSTGGVQDTHEKQCQALRDLTPASSLTHPRHSLTRYPPCDQTPYTSIPVCWQGHTGSCRALAPHPSRPWFVTGGTDSVLRLWDARSRRQLSAARLLERVCSAAFHPAG